jgi:hypothetical protein
MWFGPPEHNTLRPWKIWIVLLKSALPDPYLFSGPCEVTPVRAFYSSKSDSYIETRGLTDGPELVENPIQHLGS